MREKRVLLRAETLCESPESIPDPAARLQIRRGGWFLAERQNAEILCLGHLELPLTFPPVHFKSLHRPVDLEEVSGFLEDLQLRGLYGLV